MPALTKKRKVEYKIKAHCQQNKITLYPLKGNPVLECWEKIPPAMVKKLNTDELFEYIRLHILPGMQSPPLKNFYMDDWRNPGKPKEYYA